jgi:hypothetical protein
MERCTDADVVVVFRGKGGAAAYLVVHRLSEAAGSIAAVNVIRTTPPRPFDVAAAFPQLAA